MNPNQKNLIEALILTADIEKVADYLKINYSSLQIRLEELTHTHLTYNQEDNCNQHINNLIN